MMGMQILPMSTNKRPWMHLVFAVLLTTVNLGCEEEPLGLNDAEASLQVSPWSLNFGEQPLLQSAQASLTVVNDGDIEIDVDRVSVEGDVESFLAPFWVAFGDIWKPLGDISVTFWIPSFKVYFMSDFCVPE